MSEISPEMMAGPARWRRSSTGETAMQAARAVTPSAPNMRARVLGVLISQGVPMCAEEIAAVLENQGLKPLFTSVRSRLSDLKALGLVDDSGQRGRAYGGCKAVKWAVVTAKVAALSEKAEAGA